MKFLPFIAIAAVLTGCATRPQPVVVPDPPPKPAEVTEAPRLSARQMARALPVAVAIAPADAESPVDSRLAAAALPNIQRVLCGAGFDIVAADSAVAEVSGAVRCVGERVRGERSACRGSLELTFRRLGVRNPVTGDEIAHIVNVRRFDAKGNEAWTRDEAIVSLSDELSAQVGAWLQESCSSIAADLALCTVAVGADGAAVPLDPDYATKFALTVLGIRGVYGCEIPPASKAATKLEANILYDTRQIPEGILNRLRSIPALNLE